MPRSSNAWSTSASRSLRSARRKLLKSAQALSNDLRYLTIDRSVLQDHLHQFFLLTVSNVLVGIHLPDDLLSSRDSSSFGIRGSAEALQIRAQQRESNPCIYISSAERWGFFIAPIQRCICGFIFVSCLSFNTHRLTLRLCRCSQLVCPSSPMQRSSRSIKCLSFTSAARPSTTSNGSALAHPFSAMRSPSSGSPAVDIRR